MSENPLIVRIETSTLGETTNAVRTLVDSMKIQISGFMLKPTGVEIVFGSEDDAERFREQFGDPLCQSI